MKQTLEKKKKKTTRARIRNAVRPLRPGECIGAKRVFAAAVTKIIAPERVWGVGVYFDFYCTRKSNTTVGGVAAFVLY